MRVGVLGGTFDPIHRGHVAAAGAAIECADLDRVVFVPTGMPPHRGAAVADGEQRLAMCRLAVAADPRFSVSDIEVRRDGLSYTADTLAALRRESPGDQLFLILGWDAARQFATWHRPDEVRRLARIVVVTRPGTSRPDSAALREAGLDEKSVIICEGDTPDISASALRDALARGSPVGEMLPAPVEGYIAEHHLYVDNRDIG